MPAPTLTALETRLAAAKAAGDSAAVRALIPAVNAGRRAFREFAEAYAAQQAGKGLDIDGQPLGGSLMVRAIFGEQPADAAALARLQARWESGLTLDPEDTEESGPEFAALARAHGAVDDGQFEVEICEERYRFADRDQALAFRRALPGMGYFRDLGATPEPFMFFEEV